MQAGQSDSPSDEFSDGTRNIETRIWVRLLTLHGAVYARLNRALLRQFGISLAKFDVLAQLYRFGDGLSQGKLSQHLKVTGGNVTGLVRRLVSDGLITRQMSSTDRRSFVVSFTPKGRALFEEARRSHDAWLAEWFGGLAPGDLEAALASLNRLCSQPQAR